MIVGHREAPFSERHRILGHLTWLERSHFHPSQSSPWPGLHFSVALDCVPWLLKEEGLNVLGHRHWEEGCLSLSSYCLTLISLPRQSSFPSPSLYLVLRLSLFFLIIFILSPSSLPSFLSLICPFVHLSMWSYYVYVFICLHTIDQSLIQKFCKALWWVTIALSLEFFEMEKIA